ncbi:hypothetical protein JM18_001314 [Phytophthora kernoviae]|uniref:Protein kinase domain-containing protein n=1 Tax=Phytophthora kernoviae TaxID=325452 RepID=A0A921VDI0_9STRA|nr:hypothetical protein JM18_001314 [Phytophthora kernoviae]
MVKRLSVTTGAQQLFLLNCHVCRVRSSFDAAKRVICVPGVRDQGLAVNEVNCKMPRKISSEINSKAKLDKYEEFHKQAMDATEEHQEEELSLLTSVMVVGRQYPCLSNDPPILRQIDAFVDYSSQYSLPLACKQSLRLVKRVIARTGWNGAKAIAELCEAAGRGDSHVIEWLCTVGEELGGVQASDLVNEIDFGGGTPLYMAARAGRLGILEALMDKGARLDKKDERGRTVIHMAASNGDCRVVQWLVSKGALVDEKDGDGNTPLCKAAQYGRLAMVQWLAEKVARLEEQNDSNQTALHLAASASRQSLAVVEFFVGKGLRVCETDEWGHSALYYAIGAHNFEIAEFFLDECFTEEKPQESELYDALFAAVNSDDDMFLEYLEGKFELDICHVNAQGRTALHEAAAGGALNMVYLLLDRGVDTCKSDKFGVTPVIEASRCGHVSILHSILGAKGKVDDLDLAGRSALHHAAAAGHAHVVEELLALDVDLDCCDKTNADTLSGKSALVLAMERGCSDVVDILMDPTSTGDVSVASNKASLDDYTEYLLDSAEIQFETPVLQESASGVWLGSPIAVKVKKTWQPKNFIEELERWSKLNHPHVVKLYGVCQGDNVEEPFFVFERPAQPSLFNYLQDPEYAVAIPSLLGKMGPQSSHTSVIKFMSGKINGSFGVVSNNPFIVCEYAGCGQLDEYLRDHPEEIWEKLHEAALGLRYLHVKRVVHGDLKCNNILVGNDGRAKLIDFGLSTLKAEAPSIYGEPEAELDEKAAVGAIRWKAPEVLRGEKLTYESDVYSFGMCIIEVLSGKFPWDIIDEQAIKYHVLAKKIPTLPENCSEAVRELVHQMCRFIPTERVDMRAVVEALSSLH